MRGWHCKRLKDGDHKLTLFKFDGIITKVMKDRDGK
jgi:hypothetical protein